MSSFCLNFTWSLALLTITRLSLRKHAIKNCSGTIRAYFTIFITLNGYSPKPDDVYKTCVVSKSQLLVVPALCGNWWASKVPELVAWWPLAMSRAVSLCPRVAGTVRRSSAELSHVSPVTKQENFFIIHLRNISLVSRKVNVWYYWWALTEYMNKYHIR